MKKYLILIAGCPATGKTTLIKEIKNVIPNIYTITPDEIKEALADSVGFETKIEKIKLEKQAWRFYYQALELYMRIGKRIILSEYPFSNKQKDTLTDMALTHEYHIKTIRLVGDFDVLWERRHDRDIHSQGHLCHIMTHYHDGDRLEDRSLADDLITKDDFKRKIEESRYDKFELGDLYEFDVTDYNKVNYQSFIESLHRQINMDK